MIFFLSPLFFWGGGGGIREADYVDLHKPVRKKELFTREMQGIVGQASDFELRGQRSAFCERSSQRWTLVQEIWWRKIEKIKGDRRPTLWYGFFCVHISPRTSSTVVRVQVVGVSKVRTLAGMPGLVIALDTAGACQWERGWNVEEKTLLETYSRSQLAPSYSVKEKSNSVFCLQKKKRPFVAEFSMSCGRRLHDSELQ